jgi:hypothetical protein
MAKTFKLDIAAWVEKAGARADLVVRKVSLDMLERIVMRSPVKTGRFRGHWTAGVNTVPTGLTGRLDKGGEATINAAVSTIASAGAGDRVYLANNLPYAVRLEYGHSKQAPSPPGIVRGVVDEFQAAVNKAAREAQKEKP